MLSRVAWGYFEVGIEIEFHPVRDAKSGKQIVQKPAMLYHLLSFDGTGKSKGMFIEVNDAKNQAAVIKAISEKIN